MSKLLVIDDEPNVCYTIQRLFGKDGVEVLTAGTAAEGVAQFHAQKPDVVLLDLKLPDGSGLQVFEELRRASVKRPVIFITAHGTTRTAIEAMKNGAFDYLVKPLDFEKLSDLLSRAFKAAQLMQVPAVLPDLQPVEQIVGRTSVMQEMCKTIGRVAPQDVNVLILGESGVGKELVARALWCHSRRAERPFLAINCAAIPEGLLESELFGHEKGAFTGADRQRVGKFEQCDGGTIFLDEIGDLPLSAQAKMLRLLQDQRFERVGGKETIQTHVRVLAATNQDLERGVAEGRFRSDLYFRLKGVTIQVPALRERMDDLPDLAHHFLFTFNRELGLNLQGFDPETLACLAQHRWPGNVRELQSVIREAMLRSVGPLLLPEFLPPSIRAGPSTHPATAEPAGAFDLTAFIDDLLRQGQPGVYNRVIREVERLLLTQALRHTQGHQAQASELLGLNRSTLRYKLRDLGLSVDRVVGETLPP